MSSNRLDGLPDTFSTLEAKQADISRSTIHRWKQQHVIEELSRGVYRKSTAPPSAHVDLLAVAKRAPRGVICLLSALALHDLTDEVPPATQVAVPRNTNVPHISYPPVEVLRFDADTFGMGRMEFEAAPGELVAMYNAERSIVDAMRLRHRIGEPVALQALRRYLTAHGARPATLIEYARELSVEGPVRAAAEVVLS